MQQLTQEGTRIVNELSGRYGFSADAVTHMMIAVLNGNGSMAQFSHPEFGGSGQWMRGGMLMLGDMFNTGLKNSVNSLCNELSNLLANQPGLMQSGSFQSQSQGGSSQQSQASGSGGLSGGSSSLFVPDPEQNWWPAELGAPNSLGSQNNIRYAYFSMPCRLAVKTGSDVWVYDTLDHQIGGFSQQQGGGSSITFTSQYGTVNLSTLPTVSINGQAVQKSPPSAAANEQPAPPADNAASAVHLESTQPEPGQNASEIIDAISKLGELREKGILTDDEFASKKADLLARL